MMDAFSTRRKTARIRQAPDGIAAAAPGSQKSNEINETRPAMAVSRPYRPSQNPYSNNLSSRITS
jgi:hypothetical protein